MPAEVAPARMPDGTPSREWPTWMLRAVRLAGFATVLSLALVASGLALNDNVTLLAGAIPAAALALIVQAVFELAEKRFVWLPR